MDFHPGEFPPEARDRIEKEKIRAYRELLPNRVYDFEDQDLAIRCIMRIFLAFAKEACALRRERGWTIERIERESKEFLRRVTIMVVFDKFPGLRQHWISNMNGSIDSDVERRFRETPEWKEYEELLLTTPALAASPKLPKRPDTNDKEFETQLERGRATLEAARQVLDPLPEDVARKARNDAFEKKLHEAAMGVLDRLPGAPASTLGPAEPNANTAGNSTSAAPGPSPEQNLRDAILKKKARIVEIECTVDRPQEKASRLRLGEEREYLLVEVEELEAGQREALVDRAIASRKRRMESSMAEGAHDANSSVLDTQKSRALLGIELAGLENLRYDVRRKFFDEARLPPVVQAELEPIVSSKKMPDPHVDLALTFTLTKEYQKAISRASAQLADLLATAAISRISQAHFREAIWRECLDFGYQLGQWDDFARWVDRVIHFRWQVVGADGTQDREQLEKTAKPRREFFEGRIAMYSQEWLSAIDQAIELRHTVSASHTVNASGEIEEQTLGMASTPAKAEAAAKEQHAETQALSLKLQRGKRCAQIVEEMKRFRYLRLDSGRTVSEIQTDCSDFLIWKLRENLSAEDRDLFDHPNRWESVVTYVYGLLGKEYAKSWTTIRDWVKVWNRSQQADRHIKTRLSKRK